MASAYCESERLIIRPIVPDDEDALVEVHSDPRMSTYFPTVFDRDYVIGFIARVREAEKNSGFCFGAAIDKGTGVMIGTIGLMVIPFEAPFTPAVEVGWRVACPYWGRGYASEGARVSIDWGFDELGLSEIVSIAVPENARSTRVMRRIGMRRDEQGDFDHPTIPDGSPLKRHVLYRLGKAEWLLGKTAPLGKTMTG